MMSAAYLKTISARQAIRSVLAAERLSCAELALGCAACKKGFLKMLIHRWYRMLQPSA